MPPESINLSTLLLIVFVICAAYMLLRGTLRILTGCLVLGGSAWVGLRVWALAPDFSRKFFGVPYPWLSIALALFAFALTFFIAGKLCKWLTNPFRKSDDGPRPLTLSRLLGAAFLSLIPTCLLGTILAVFILHFGEVEEMRRSAPGTGAPARSTTSEILVRWRQSVISWVPTPWLRWFDPLIDPARLPLAQAIRNQSTSPLPPAIDPKTGKIIPRAIIVEDPELQNLARQGSFSSLLRHPMLTQALQDPTVQSFLKSLHLTSP